MALLRKNFQKIKCPVCGYEYLPVEIIIPEYLFAKPDLIIREGKKIVTYTGRAPDLMETYQCDYCNAKFKIQAVTTFRYVENKRKPIEFEEDGWYVSDTESTSGPDEVADE